MSSTTGPKHFILLNGSYGCFIISDAALAELHKRHPDGTWYTHEPERTDPQVVALFFEQPELFKDLCTEIYCKEISHDVFESKAYSIDEYDGNEVLKINWQKVKTFKTRKILTCEDLSAEEKVKQLSALLL